MTKTLLKEAKPQRVAATTRSGPEAVSQAAYQRLRALRGSEPRAARDVPDAGRSGRHSKRTVIKPPAPLAMLI